PPAAGPDRAGELGKLALQHRLVVAPVRAGSELQRDLVSVRLRRGDPAIRRGLLHDYAVQPVSPLPHVYLQRAPQLTLIAAVKMDHPWPGQEAGHGDRAYPNV